MTNAGMATTHYQLSETLSNNGAALSRLQSQGVKTLQFSDDVWDAFGRASAEVMDENMGDEMFAKIRASFEASMATSSSWINKSDGYYVEQRNRVLGGWHKILSCRFTILAMRSCTPSSGWIGLTSRP